MGQDAAPQAALALGLLRVDFVAKLFDDFGEQ
jgi:hypothetical protein